MQFRPDIDGLRAISVLSVVAFHAFPEWVPGGFVGVDVFFVISGFLISKIIFGGLDRNTFSFAEFYQRRVRRIFPALLLVLAACLAIGWFVLLPDEFGQLSKQIVGGAGFVSNFVLWHESGYFDRANETKPLLHLWSLGIEEQFYILWPALLWLAWKLRLGLAAIIATAGLSFTLNIALYQLDPVADFYSPLTRFWELMAGSALAYVTLYGGSFLRKQTARTRIWAKVMPRGLAGAIAPTLCDLQSMLGVLAISIGILVITRDDRYPGFLALLPVLGSTLVIAAGSTAIVNRQVLSSTALVWIGLISYPLYLWHWPLLSFAHIIEGGEPSVLVRFALIVIAVAAALLTYLMIESPIRHGDHGRAKVMLVCASMLVLVCFGCVAYARDGLPGRFPKIVQDLTSYKYDFRTAYREGACFLEPAQGYDQFAGCFDTQSTKKHTMVLWGDSHAAHLYPGYVERLGGDTNIIQLTASGCPPILGLTVADRPHCKSTNDLILRYIGIAKPDRVVLAAGWVRYGDKWQKLQTTLAELKRIGIARIDLVGPVPAWQGSLPQQLYAQFKRDALHRIPDRLKTGLVANIAELDISMAAFANGSGVTYLSPTSVLCNTDGCLAKLGLTSDTLVAWDNAHFTKRGSAYVVSKFPID